MNIKKDLIPGGLAKGKSLQDIANHHKTDIDTIKSALKQGIKIESEHTTDKKIAAEIALDHIWEDPEYYNKLSKIEEIRIKSANNPEYFPKDESWYTIVNNNTFRSFFDIIGDWYEDDGVFADEEMIKEFMPQIAHHNINYHGDNKFFMYDFDDFDDDTIKDMLANAKFIPFKGVMNEIKINNINNPKLVFPKDENWYIEINDNNIDYVFDILKDTDFSWYSSKGYNYTTLLRQIYRNGKALLAYELIHNEISWEPYNLKSDFFNNGYKKITSFINEIKIRNINKPTHFPKDVNWSIIVDKSNIKVLQQLKNEGYQLPDKEDTYDAIERKDKIYIAYDAESKHIDWDIDDWFVDGGYKQFEPIDPNILDEIKIRNANINQINLPKDKEWYTILDKDNVDQFIKWMDSTYTKDNTPDIIMRNIEKYGTTIAYNDLTTEWLNDGNDNRIMVSMNTPTESSWLENHGVHRIDLLNEIRIQNINKGFKHLNDLDTLDYLEVDDIVTWKQAEYNDPRDNELVPAQLLKGKVINIKNGYYNIDVLGSDDDIWLNNKDFKYFINSNWFNYNLSGGEDDYPTEDEYHPININEVISDATDKIKDIREFIEYAIEDLGISIEPEFTFSTDPNESKEKHTFGQYNPNENTIWVYIGNRNLADICRTIAHELVHCKQNEENRINDTSGETGSEIENEANASAGKILRDYGQNNEKIYENINP